MKYEIKVVGRPWLEPVAFLTTQTLRRRSNHLNHEFAIINLEFVDNDVCKISEFLCKYSTGPDPLFPYTSAH